MKRTKFVVAALAAALAASTVGSLGSADAQSSVRGVTSSTIKVGGLGYAAFYSDAGQAAKARFDEANQNGEIPGGRKIDYVGFSDDKTTAATRTCRRAGAWSRSRACSASCPWSRRRSRPVRTSTSRRCPRSAGASRPAYCDPSNKYVFGFTGCLVPNPPTYPGNTWGELVDQQLKSQGEGGAKGKTAAVIAENNDSGKQGVEVITATAKAVGMKVVYQQASMPPLPATVTDYSPYVQAIMTSNSDQPPDVVFLVVGQNNVFGLGKALTQAGYTGIQTNAVSYAPQLTKLADTWSAFTQFATPESTAPNMQKVVQTLNDAGIATADIGQPALAGYFSADMFVQILKKVGKNLTPEAVPEGGGEVQVRDPRRRRTDLLPGELQGRSAVRRARDQ